MTKNEFLSTLRVSLAGELTQESIDMQINYYNDYIDSEIRMGKTEEQVIKELGDPRLIAKTIINTQGTSHYEYEHKDQKSESTHNRSTKFNSWIRKFVGIAILILVVLFVFLIIGGIAVLFVNLALPILIIVLIIYLFRKRW